MTDRKTDALKTSTAPKKRKSAKERNSEVGKRLQQARYQKRVTLERLEILTDIPKSQLMEIESGDKKLTEAKAKKSAVY